MSELKDEGRREYRYDDPGKEDGKDGEGIEDRRPEGKEMDRDGMRGVQRGRVRKRTVVCQ